MLWKCGERVRLAAGLACAAALVGVVGGCGKEKVKDPYVFGTLRAVTRGFIQSKGFLFEINTPEFVFANGSTAVVRDGNLLEILVFPDIENRAATLAGKVLGVEKRFDPYVYLVAKRVKDGTAITPVDSVPKPVLPKVIAAPDLGAIPGFNLAELKWNGDPEKLNDRVELEFQTVARLVYREDPTFGMNLGMPAATPDSAAAAADTTPPSRMAWFLTPPEGGDSLLKISNVTPELEFVLRLLEAENLPFYGACTLREVYTIKARRDTKVTGRLDIGWVRYGNRYLGA